MSKVRKKFDVSFLAKKMAGFYARIPEKDVLNSFLMQKGNPCKRINRFLCKDFQGCLFCFIDCRLRGCERENHYFCETL